VRFERPAVVEALAAEDGSSVRLKYYDYGVVCAEFERQFDCGWDELRDLAARWVAEDELVKRGEALIRRAMERWASVFVDPYRDWLSEDYSVIHVREAAESGQPLGAEELIGSHGPRIAQILRGEPRPLAASEVDEILSSRRSYYPTDLFVAAWTAAFVYDRPADAAPVIQLLEYANAQLLEFRRYDTLLTDVLGRVYRKLDERSGFWVRWRLAREAERLNTIRLDIMELTERVDSSIKFLSDMYHARLYRLAAQRVGVSDYRKLVEDKLRAAGELYQFMVNEFHQSAMTLLELVIVIILVIDLAVLFWGKP
jgi:hypothetical protein